MSICKAFNSIGEIHTCPCSCLSAGRIGNAGSRWWHGHAYGDTVK